MRYETDHFCRRGFRKLTGKAPSFVWIILWGLMTTEAVASLHVYFGNLSLYDNLTAIQAAGYLPVPGPAAMGRLREVEPALAGGLFFALTLGAGLTLATATAVWAWVRMFSRSRAALAVLILGWAAMLIAVNGNGVNPLPSCYFLFVPAVVGLISLPWAKGPAGRFNGRAAAIQLLPLLALAALWGTQFDDDMFLRIRDHLLFSNPIGRAVNDFYYRYTLYAAEVFKPLHQKTLRTCFIEENLDKALGLRVESALRNRDVLSLPDRGTADLVVGWNDRALLLTGARGPALKIAVEDFLSDPDGALTRLSLAWDKNAFLRSAVFLSLLLGFPVALYCLTLGLASKVLGWVMKPAAAQAAATAGCLLIGVAFFLAVWQARVPASRLGDPNRDLVSEKSTIRLAALKRIAEQGLEIGDCPTYRRLLESPIIAERYWLARALGVSRKGETYPDLVRLLDDPHPNVVCQAYYGLGQRGRATAISRILEKMQASDHWYSQWYGYRALKALGWQQPRSTQKPS
jgi:hypothetical protein